MKLSNLFANIPQSIDSELFENILRNDQFKLERIVSHGQRTPDGQWYDQERDEWVILLKGRAELLIENQSEPLKLNPGDYILLPAHVRHRVEWTSEEENTIWLALHFN